MIKGLYIQIHRMINKNYIKTYLNLFIGLGCIEKIYLQIRPPI